jgi:hypothetical protein
MSKLGFISFKRAEKLDLKIKKIFKEGFIVENQSYQGWPYHLLPTPSLFLKLLENWKENPPSKKILEDFKGSINAKDVNYYAVDCYHKEFVRFPNNLFELTVLYLNNEKGDKEEIFQIIELLIYFGAEIKNSFDIIEGFEYIIKAQDLILKNNHISYDPEDEDEFDGFDEKEEFDMSDPYYENKRISSRVMGDPFSKLY